MAQKLAYLHTSPDRMVSWATSSAVRRVMQGKIPDTKPEIAVRSACMLFGCANRVAARPIASLSEQQDLVFRNARVASSLMGVSGMDVRASLRQSSCRVLGRQIATIRIVMRTQLHY